MDVLKIGDKVDSFTMKTRFVRGSGEIQRTKRNKAKTNSKMRQTRTAIGRVIMNKFGLVELSVPCLNVITRQRRRLPIKQTKTRAFVITQKMNHVLIVFFLCCHVYEL